jgi:vacuolar protein sorting-associated protein 33A
MIAERVLEEEGVYGDVTVGQFNLDLIPFDDDVLSLELDNCYRECFLDGDRTSLFYVARSLMKLQALFGIIPRIQGVGKAAELVKDMLLRMRREMGGDEPTVLPEIDSLVLIDRQVDMATPMPTQLTYEGLVDEVFGIHNSYVDLDADIVIPEPKEGQPAPPRPPPGKKVKHPLNSNDQLYSELRDLNFSALGPVLNRKAKEIDDYYQQRFAVQSITEIRDFMRSLGSVQDEHQALRIHTNVAERIAKITKTDDFHRRLEAEQTMLADGDEGVPLAYIDETIDRQGPLLKVLRLLVLYSVTQNGLPSRLFDHYRREIVQTYGYEYIFTLDNMLRLGLLTRAGATQAKPAFKLARRPLRLFNPGVNEKDPDDLSYVYSGYAPLTARLVQMARAPGWGHPSIAPVLDALGPHFDLAQKLPAGVAADVEKKNKASQQQGIDQPRITLIFFIGGVTFTEISALRYLQRQEESKREFIICTTKLINGDSLLNTIIDTVDGQK